MAKLNQSLPSAKSYPQGGAASHSSAQILITAHEQRIATQEWYAIVHQQPRGGVKITAWYV